MQALFVLNISMSQKGVEIKCEQEVSFSFLKSFKARVGKSKLGKFETLV
jgi:hypothetical protein